MRVADCARDVHFDISKRILVRLNYYLIVGMNYALQLLIPAQIESQYEESYGPELMNKWQQHVIVLLLGKI